MLHLFALIVLLTPPSQAKATVTNTTLFDIHLHGNTHELDKIKDMASEMSNNGTAYKHGLRLHNEPVINVVDGHSNLTRAQTDAVIDILYRTPLLVNKTECQVYKHLPIHACGGANNTDTQHLKDVVKTLQASCNSDVSAWTDYADERGIRACFDDNLQQGASCAGNTLACIQSLGSLDTRMATQIQDVLQGPSISKRSHLTADATAVVLYKRATSPKELDNARTTALWTAVVSIIGLIGAVIALIVGPLLLGVTLGATGLVLTGVGIIASILAINTNLAVYRKLGQAQKDIQGRQDISNTTVIVPPKPWFCPAFPIFQSCQ